MSGLPVQFSPFVRKTEETLECGVMRMVRTQRPVVYQVNGMLVVHPDNKFFFDELRQENQT